MGDARWSHLSRPVPNEDSHPFWDGCRNGKLLLQQCQACGNVRYPPRPMCPTCSALTSEWVEAVGRGRIYSWVVAHHAAHPALADEVPYNIVLVELEEGPRMVSNLLDVAPEVIAPNDPVEVVFVRVDEDLTLPQFRLSNPR